MDWTKEDAPTETYTCGKYTILKFPNFKAYSLLMGVASLGSYSTLAAAQKKVSSIEEARKNPLNVYPPQHTPVFVFGSNLAGRHGKGAALHARNHYGAVQYRPEGYQGRAYAIPTRTASFDNLTLAEIGAGLERFSEFVKANLAMTFMLTPIGCGLAGYSREQIWPIVKALELPHNVLLTQSWLTED